MNESWLRNRKKEIRDSSRKSFIERLKKMHSCPYLFIHSKQGGKAKPLLLPSPLWVGKAAVWEWGQAIPLPSLRNSQKRDEWSFTPLPILSVSWLLRSITCRSHSLLNLGFYSLPDLNCKVASLLHLPLRLNSFTPSPPLSVGFTIAFPAPDWRRCQRKREERLLIHSILERQ